MQKKIYRNLLLIVFAVLIAYNSWAVGEKNTHSIHKINGKRPDIPGKLQFNFGFNFLTDSEKKTICKNVEFQVLEFLLYISI